MSTPADVLGPTQPCVVCEKRPATDACPRDWPTAGVCLCHPCHAAQRLAFACPCMSTEQAIAINDANGGSEAAKAALTTIASMHPAQKGTTMRAKKKSKNGSNGETETKHEPLPNGVPKGAVARQRRSERLPCKSDDSVVAIKARELARLEHLRTAFREDWKSKCSTARERRAYFEERIEELADEVDGQVEFKEVEVQDYLLPDNEVIAVRLDTGEVIARKTATAEDLQETIPGSEGGSKGKRKQSSTADATAE